jgi:hypothetical protein
MIINGRLKFCLCLLPEGRYFTGLSLNIATSCGAACPVKFISVLPMGRGIDATVDKKLRFAQVFAELYKYFQHILIFLILDLTYLQTSDTLALDLS